MYLYVSMYVRTVSERVVYGIVVDAEGGRSASAFELQHGVCLQQGAHGQRVRLQLHHHAAVRARGARLPRAFLCFTHQSKNSYKIYFQNLQFRVVGIKRVVR